MAVDADTKKYLDEVKKGKARRFVMICKGVKILSLVVYKKGTVEKYKKQAKSEGKGQFYHGVVDGKGQNISFKLLTSDGYDKPPGKELILKDFLKSQAGMQFKPAYEIVEELPAVNEAEDLEPTADQAPTEGDQDVVDAPAPLVPEAPPLTDGNLADQFKSRLTALVPQIKQNAGTPVGDQAKLKASEAGMFARKSDYGQAIALLGEAEELLKQSSATVPEAPPLTDGNLADQFKMRLTALVPQIKQSVGTPVGDQAKLKASEAGMFARKGDYGQAIALLGEAEALLKQSSATVPEAPPLTDGNLADQFKSRLTALVPQIKQNAGTPTGDQAKLKASEAGTFARKGDYGQAIALLGEAEEALKQASDAAPPVAKKTGEEMARESYEKAQAEGIIDRGFELDAKTVAQMTKLTMESAEYQKFATGFTKFVSDCNLGADAQKIPVTIWAKLIDGLSKSGYIKGAIKHVEGDPRQFILAEINSDGGKLIRDELLAQAMAGLQPFVDHAAIYLDKVIQKAAQGSTWAFWSGVGAKDAAKKESHGGIVLEGTVGAWFDEVWDFKALTSQAESLALWSSLSELYAKKAAEYFDKFKFIGFVGPGATRDQSVFNKIEQPTFVEVLNTKAQVQPPEIDWYLVDCEQADGKWVWTQNPSVAMGNDRAVALAEVAKRYDNAAAASADGNQTEEAASIPEAPPIPEANLAGLFKARLTALVPQIKQAAGTPAGDEAKLKASEAAVLARKGDYGQAIALLDQVEQLFNNSQAEQAEPPQAPDAPVPPENLDPNVRRVGEYELRKAELQADYDRCLKEQIGDTDRMRATLAFADGKAESSDFAAAEKSLVALAGIIADAMTEAAERPDPQGKSEVVAYRKSLLNWRQATQTVSVRLAALQAAVLAEFPEAASDVGKLDEILNRLDDGLIECLDEALVAQDEARREELHELAASLVQDYLAFVTTDATIKHVDNNDWVQVNVENSLTTALTEIAKHLGA